MSKKPTRELYRGTAVIMNVDLVGVEDWKDWEKRDLPESDLANAFKIKYDVAEGDANGARHDVIIEYSHRELKGDMLNWYRHEDGTCPTQIDVAMRSLKQQGLVGGLTEADVDPALDDAICGHEVTIRAFEEQDDKGKWWPRCTFASKVQLIRGADKAARLAAFRAGKPAPKREDAPAAANTAIPAPAEDPNEDMPF